MESIHAKEKELDNSLQAQSMLSVLYAQSSPEYEASNIQTYVNAKSALDRALNDVTWTAAIEQKDNFENSNTPPNKANNKLIAWVNIFNFSSNGNNLYSNCFPILILYHNNLKLIWKIVAQAVHFEKRVGECLLYKNLICLYKDHTLT